MLGVNVNVLETRVMVLESLAKHLAKEDLKLSETVLGVPCRGGGGGIGGLRVGVVVGGGGRGSVGVGVVGVGGVSDGGGGGGGGSGVGVGGVGFRYVGVGGGGSGDGVGVGVGGVGGVSGVGVVGCCGVGGSMPPWLCLQEVLRQSHFCSGLLKVYQVEFSHVALGAAKVHVNVHVWRFTL